MACLGVLLVACGGDAPVSEALMPIASATSQAVEAANAPIVPPPVPMPVPSPPERTTPSRPRLMLTLRSTPAGAAASVDGRLVGTTPVRWEMEDDGKSHEFGFVLVGHTPWKLRFSPARDGVIHATLEALPEGADAGAGAGAGAAN